MERKILSLHNILLAILLTSLFLMSYWPHFNYSYPLHIDEWKHLMEAKKIGLHAFTFEENKIEFFFDSLLYLGSWILPIIALYQFFPALCWLLSGFLLYVLVRQHANRWVALSSLFFLIGMKSNINILGHYFFTPLTASLPFVLLYLILLSRIIAQPHFTKINLRYLLLFLLLILTFLLYPPSAVLEGFIMLLFLHRLRKKFLLLSGILILVVVLGIFLSFLSEYPIGSTLAWATKYIFFEKGWGVAESEYNLLLLIGMVPLFLLCYGAVKEFKAKKYFLFCLPLYPLLMILCYHFFSFTLFIPYQRCLFFIQVFSIPLIAIGFISLLKAFTELIHQDILKNFVSGVLIGFLLVYLVVSAIVFTQQYPFYHLVEKSDLLAFDYLQSFPYGIVITPLKIALPLSVMTKHDVIATAYYYGTPEEKNHITKFYLSTCEEQMNIFQELHARYIYSYQDLGCFHRIYDEDVKLYVQ